jgi:hypothetical protein
MVPEAEGHETLDAGEFRIGSRHDAPHAKEGQHLRTRSRRRRRRREQDQPPAHQLDDESAEDDRRFSPRDRTRFDWHPW